MTNPESKGSTATAIVLASMASGVMTIAIIATQAAPSGSHPRPVEDSQTAPIADEAPESRISENGFELVSETIVLPEETSEFPTGPGSEAAVNNCTACHSASMALTQPPLTTAQWTATVEKMRKVYHANVAASDVSPIVAYLRTLRGQGSAAPVDKSPPQSGNTGADSG